MREDNLRRKNSVLITGVTGQVGRTTIDVLVRRGIRATALIRRDQPLEGCVTISNWLTSERAVTAIGHAEVVVHLAGNLNPRDHDYERANVGPTKRVAGALDSDRTRRVIFLSYVGAAYRVRTLQQSRNPLSRGP